MSGPVNENGVELGYFETLGDLRRATASLPDETSVGTRDEQPGFFIDFDPDVLIRGREPGKFREGLGLLIIQATSENMSLRVAEAVLEEVGYADLRGGAS